MSTGIMLACRPVVYTEDYIRVAEQGGVTLPPAADPHSEIGKCQSCQVEIYVGPRVSLVMQTDPDALLVCLMCAVAIHRITKALGADPEVQHLGGP